MLTKEAIRKEWIRRLRSGTIEQAKKHLGFSDGSRCCLGVLCNMAVENGVILPPVQVYTPEGDRKILRYNESCGVLPCSVRDWVGLKDNMGGYNEFNSLTADNDEGFSFLQIADIIEREEKGLFKADPVLI